MKSHWIIMLSAIAMFVARDVGAQEVVFQTSFETEDGLVPWQYSEDAEFTFDYDYNDFDDIPEAPNSELVGGEPFRGLKLEANLAFGAYSAIAVGTEDLGLTGKYAVQVDAWLNYNFPAINAGTTEFGGLSVGHSSDAENISGATFLYDTDGDTSSDYRLYKNSTFQVLNAETAPLMTAQYAVESIDNSGEPFVSTFPGVNIGETLDQGFEGTTSDGSGGFRWMVIEAIVDADTVGPSGLTDDKGIATFSITEAASGETIEIGTIDNSNGDGVVNMTGEVAVVFADIFSSVSNDPDLSFGIFDNLIVTSLPATTDPLDCNNDGSVTADDVACASADTISATLTAASLLGGDLDLNGKVEFADFLTFSGNFGITDKGGGYANGDIDLNGAVEFADFLTLSGNFGKTANAAQSVPEPSGLAVFCLGALLLAPLRRRT